MTDKQLIDIAIEASDITLVSDDISQIPHMLALSKKMMGKIKVNILLSMILNITGVVLAMFAVLNPVSAALFHNIGSVLVVVNSALLLGWKSSFDRAAETSAPRPVPAPGCTDSRETCYFRADTAAIWGHLKYQ